MSRINLDDVPAMLRLFATLTTDDMIGGRLLALGRRIDAQISADLAAMADEWAAREAEHTL